MTTSRLSHIKITVTNFSESKKFYDLLFRKLGWKVFISKEKSRGYFGKDSSFWIEEGENRDSKFDRENAGLDHIAFKAESKGEVDEFAVWLKAGGMVILHEPKFYPEYAKNYYAVFFLDPDGIILEFTNHD